MNIIPNDGFWKRQEIANQFVHFGISFLSGWALYKAVLFFTGLKIDYTLCIGCLIGFCVEIVQASKLTREEAKKRLPDDIRDILFWCLGSFMLFVMKYYPM